MSAAALRQNGVALAGFALTVAIFGVACWAYLGLGAYLDHIEGSVVVSGWEYISNGMPLYQLQDGVPRFATYYGPLSYLVEALVPAAVKASITITKLASMTAAAATLLMMAKHFLSRGGWDAASLGLFYLAAGMLMFVPQSFWVRPDPFEMLLVATGVALAASPIAIGLCIGLAVNFKIHAFVYFFPILIETSAARRWRSLFVIMAVAATTFALPFLAPGISLHDYLAGLSGQIGGRHPSGAEIASVLIPALVLALPVLYALLAQRDARPDRLYALTALATLALLFYPAAIPGAGPYHFLPLVPVLADALARLRPRVWAAGIAILPLLFLGFLAAQTVSHSMAERRGWEAIATDALALARQAPTDAVQIGYGDSRESYDIAELSRAVLTLGGYPAQIDAQILMELSPIGIDGSQRWIASLTHCDTKRWLLPKGEKPFALTNFLYGLGPIFDADFRRAFLEHYRLIASDQHFDVWECVASAKDQADAN